MSYQGQSLQQFIEQDIDQVMQHHSLTNKILPQNVKSQGIS